MAEVLTSWMALWARSVMDFGEGEAVEEGEGLPNEDKALFDVDVPVILLVRAIPEAVAWWGTGLSSGWT